MQIRVGEMKSESCSNVIAEVMEMLLNVKIVVVNGKK